MSAISQAVILAAGMGTRIRGEQQPLPKPLVRVGGISLLKRSLLTAKRAGITRFVIVVGFDGDRVQHAIASDSEVNDLDLVWVANPDYKLSNGVSVLKARPHVEGEFFLMMADHIVEQDIYRTLQGEPARGGLVLAVDRKLDTIFDMDDATKVKTGPNEAIVEIGKALTDFDAVDTGVFRCSPALFDALDTVLEAEGDTSLSHGVKALAARGKARVADVGGAWWQDVDTPETRKYAEKVLLKKLTKSIDGPVSKLVNRRVSKLITRSVMNLPVVPNHMTFVGLIVGLAAAVVTALVTPEALWMIPLGGVLYQLSSIIDGVDGELARLKFKHSDWGEWFDTVSDSVINLSYQLALGIAVFRVTADPLWWQLGLTTFVMGTIVVLTIFRSLASSGKRSHLAIEWDFESTSNPNKLQAFFKTFKFVGKRDFYALVLMVLSFGGAGMLKFAVAGGFWVVGCVTVAWFFTMARQATLRRRTLARGQS
jgi:CDP-L-myo-inositol myo-inositolphosphotransferase